MDAKTKRKVKGRVLTLISKVNELKILGYEDSEIQSVLPCNLEGWEQNLMEVYSQIECV